MRVPVVHHAEHRYEVGLSAWACVRTVRGHLNLESPPGVAAARVAEVKVLWWGEGGRGARQNRTDMN